MMMRKLLYNLLVVPVMMLNACVEHAGTVTMSDAQASAVPAVSASVEPWPRNKVLVLAYHDIADDVSDPASLTTRTVDFQTQMAWLEHNRYVPVSIAQILAARDGKAPLPAKAVLLTFDDGYRSMYDRVFPLLKEHQWPALFSPVGAWVDTPEGQPVDFAGQPRPRELFVTWDQVREMSASGLVEIGAHTQNLHYGTVANPQHNLEPAAAALRYDLATQRYETPAEFRERLDDDIQAITATIKRVTGKSPRVWVWPYGAVSGIGLELIQTHGYAMAMSLSDGLLDTSRLMNVPRMLVVRDANIASFANDISEIESSRPMRTVRVDLDYVYDSDPAQMEENVGKLVQRLADLRPSAVMLQAYAEPKGDGAVHETYFPNSQLPMRADLFNRVVTQIRTRMPQPIRIYAWMPVLSVALPGLPHVMEMTPEGKRRIDPKQYRRLTPFSAEVRERLKVLYREMAASVPTLDGVAFHDDLLMSDYEDVSDPGLAAMREAGFGDDILALHKDRERSMVWARYKGRFMNAFTLELLAEVRALRGGEVKSARNIFAEPVLNPASEEWYAENMGDFLATYDYVMPMLMPFMEGVREPQAIHDWMAQAVAIVRRYPHGLEQTVFELQAQDWHSETGHGDRWIASETLEHWMKDLLGMGVQNLGYYPDDFFNNTPNQHQVRAVFSTGRPSSD